MTKHNKDGSLQFYQHPAVQSACMFLGTAEPMEVIMCNPSGKLFDSLLHPFLVLQEKHSA